MSEEVVAQTLEDVPEAAPRSVRCTPLSPDSLQISWQPPPQDMTHGVIQGYKLFYETSPLEESDHTDSLTKMTPSLTTDLHGLLKYTNYSIQVLAFTRVGDGVRSHAIHCRTKEDVPGPPGAIKALPMSPNSVLVAWMPPKQPNGQVVEYGLYVRGLETGRPVDSRALHTTHLEMEVTELKRRARYEFWVTAFTKVGEGQSTPVASASPTQQVGAAIASFGGTVSVVWRQDVRLPCRVVGVPTPQRQWLAGEAPLGGRRSRLRLAPDGSIFIPNVQRSDDGDYTCRVWNEHGRDVITHHLVVQVPPAAPLLLATAASAHSVSLQWKIGDEGGSAVRGMSVHVKADGGEWEEIHVERGHSTHQLTGLLCGTQYSVYATAHNRIGAGTPSTTLAVRTQGGRPKIMPTAKDLLVVEQSGNGSVGNVALKLTRWPDGGCPVQRFVVEYSSNGDWVVVGNNIAVQDSFPLPGLIPATLYRLRITAYNSAGSSQGTYQFTTPSPGTSDSGVDFGTSSGDPGGSSRSTPMLRDPRILVPATAAILALILATGAGICLCFRLKSSPPTASATQQEQSTASMENKHNLAQREQYYASARKPPPSPAAPNPSFTTLDRIPEYAEDIYPYATFHVPTDVVTDDPGATKMQTFGFREGTIGSCESSAISVPRKHAKGEFHRRKRCGDRRVARGDRRNSEDYDSFASESDTELGTSSRTESSNQLEESVPVVLPSVHAAPASTHLNLIYPGPESSTSPEPSPVAERRSFPRTGKPSRRCVAVSSVPLSESSEAEGEADKCRRASPHFLVMQSTKDFSIRV